MKRLILLVLYVVCFYEISATNYYVGGAGASDNNPGTITQPFATIQKAASVAVAGDVVSIRAGIYRETIVPANSGNPGSPIVYQAENGARVIISGTNTADGGWTIHSGNIYKKSVTLPVNGYNHTLSNNTTLLANQVFKDGVMMFEARWPKLNTPDDLLDRTKLRQRSSTSNFNGTNITDNGIPNIPGGWVGGKIWVNGWFISTTSTITSHSGNTIGYAGIIGSDKFQQYYYLTGKLGALTQEKEWHYESGTLYFWQPGGGSPAGVEYKARNWGFNLSNRAYTTIEGLEFFGCEPMTGNTSSNNTIIKRIKAKYTNHAVMQEEDDNASPYYYYNTKQTGIKLIGPNSIIQDSEIDFAASQGIWLGQGCTMSNNKITNISYEGNYGAGVTPWDNTGNQVIKWNTMYRMGRSAIDFSNLEYGRHVNMMIEYNDIYHFGMLNVDLGGIYGARMMDLTGTRIHHNWVHDSKATDDPSAMQIGINTGIYFDQASGPCTVDHNVLWNNVQADFYNQQVYGRTAGGSLLYNNTFATDAGDTHPNHHSYVTYVGSPPDVQRNNIYRDDINVSWGNGTRNIVNVLLEGINPLFNGTGPSGLSYRLRAGSPAINAGVALPGITDGSVGAPDLGAYEFGGTDWIPGYTPQASIPPPASPPVLSITAPANSTSFAQGLPITLSANATDADGITRVEFFNGATKLGEDVTSPYSFIWNNAAAGTHSITARATDSQNSATTSAVVSVIVTANTPPTVAITGPANNAQFTAGAPITISATAADPNGSVSKVEFFNGATKVGEDLTSPYSFTWNNAPVGTHSLTARATDNQNNVTTSTLVSITISANAVPTVSITAPINNAQFVTGTSITINATAADANGTVAKVEFYSGTTLLGTDLTSPYSFTWTNSVAGTHVLTAKATDNQNNVTTSAPVSIIVSANVVPTVSITTPINNAQFVTGASVTINAIAADANGSVTKVEFYRGTTLLGTDLTSPYSFTWTNALAGTHSLTAKATDNQNNVTTSAPVSIAVSTNAAPTVSITAPINNVQFMTGAPITISATAADANGSVTKVEFYSGTTLLGTDLTSPYSFTWDDAIAGSHQLTAKATDNENSVTTSTIVSIAVAANNNPNVLITGPSNNGQFISGSPITIAATASDANGSVTKVEFFSGTTKLGEDLTAPYNFTWVDAPAGDHSLHAKATDNHNGVSSSPLIIISVMNEISATADAGQDVSLTLPNNSVTLRANGTSLPDGPQFQYNWVRLEGPSTPMFDPSLQEIELTDLVEGTYIFQLTITDSNGLTSTDEVAITVSASALSQAAIPRFFTPNGDGSGDFWVWPSNELYANSTLTVYNQAGQKVYEAVNYNNSWDGTLEGQPLLAGPYQYIIRLQDSTQIKASVRIIR